MQNKLDGRIKKNVQIGQEVEIVLKHNQILNCFN